MQNPTQQRGAAMPAILAILCGLAGLVLGPGQIVYCMFFSGSAAGEYACKPDKPITIPLAPTQNPLRLIAKIEYTKPRHIIHTAVTSYDTTLTFAGEQLWAEQIRVRESDDDDDDGGSISISMGSSYTTTPIALFSVEQEGDYTFVAKPTRDNDIKVHALTVTVRENVRVVHTLSAVAGFGLMVLAIVLVVMTARGKGGRSNVAERGTA